MAQTSDSGATHEGGWKAKVREDVAAWPRWKQVAVVGAGACVALGGVLWVVGTGEPGPMTQGTPPTTAAPPDGVANLVDPTVLPDDQAAEAGEGGMDWAPVFLRSGFSFFVGFAIGTAARSVLKLVLVFCGIFAVALFALSQFGFIDVRWDVMGEAFDGMVSSIGDNAKSITGMVTGPLPSVGLGALGLAAGFRRG